MAWPTPQHRTPPSPVGSLLASVEAARQRLGTAEARWNQALAIWAPLKSAVLTSKHDPQITARFEAARSKLKAAEAELDAAHQELKQLDEVMGERQADWMRECQFGPPAV